jgi:uncharacterized membrane protein YcaP (DUF421 family)
VTAVRSLAHEWLALALGLVQVNWRSVLFPVLDLREVVLRGTIVYLVLFVLLRLLRRQAGAIGISDLLVVVLIADAAQNAMGLKYESVTEGIVLVLTIVGWDYFLDWVGYRVPAIRRLIRPAALLLVKDGKAQRANLRKQMITMEELLSELREHEVERIEDVKLCYMEADGHISVIKKK